jgi:hypothetical protein
MRELLTLAELEKLTGKTIQNIEAELYDEDANEFWKIRLTIDNEIFKISGDINNAIEVYKKEN